MATPGEIISFKGREYRLGEVIGYGYSGVVYGCSDDWGNLLVAKVISPKFENDFERWNSECQKLYEMRHPNITHMHSAFAYNGEFFIILERCYCDITKMGSPFSLDFIYSIARDVLQGLDWIHIHGFVHKDIHAGNIFYFRYLDSISQQFLEGGHFKIGDLGITKKQDYIDPSAPSFAPWMIPPECLDLRFGQVSYVTDIYHVSLLLLALVHNRLSFNFSHRDIWNGEPERVALELQNPIGDVLARGVKRNTHERYQSAFDFWQAINSTKNTMISTHPALPMLPYPPYPPAFPQTSTFDYP
ncbi:MAG: protein kinase family protein [Planctomycetota bacterium]